MSKNQSTYTEISRPRDLPRWRRNQYLASLAANFGAIQVGIMFVWTATALPYLREDPRGLVTSISQEGWINAIMLIGALMIGPLGGYSNERIGRRRTMLLITIPSLLGSSLIYFAQNTEMLYIGRFLIGGAGGVFTVVAPTYVAETSDPDIRGKLSVGFDMGIAIGVLYMYVVGAFCGWQWQTLASAILVVIGHFLLMTVPETPRYLISKQNQDGAKKSLAWLKNTSSSDLIEMELAELTEVFDEQKLKNSASNSWAVLLKPHVLRPLLCSMCLHLASAMTGIMPIGSYAVDIFKSTGAHINEFLAAVILGIMDVMAALLSALVVDKFGRRPLLITSQLVMTGSLTAMGLFYLLKQNNHDVAPNGLDWLPVTSLGIFTFAFAFGTGPLTYTIQGEILPPEAKGVAASLIISMRWIASFLTTLFFLDIMSSLGEDGGYWLFAGFSFLGAVYVIFWVPETKGKTLEEIQFDFL